MKLALSLALSVLLAACASSDAPKPAAVSKLPPMPQPADNLPTPAKLALGKQLFADPRLSGSGKMACQSCHYRNLGWTDAQVLSRKDDGNLNTRHTPTLYNVGYQSLWYWDGRATTLDGQILAAWRAQIGADPAKVAALINTVPGYRSQFAAVWGGEATPDNIVKTLAAFFRTFVSTDSPWDRYEAGDRNAVSKDAIEGEALFAGKGGCVVCHAPPFYGNSTFFNVGLEHGKDKPDVGRFNVTKNEADRGAFKTPTLRSVAICRAVLPRRQRGHAEGGCQLHGRRRQARPEQDAADAAHRLERGRDRQDRRLPEQPDQHRNLGAAQAALKPFFNCPATPGGSPMKTFTLRFTLLAAAALASTSALAQETKVGIGISGWTGFAPLTLAKEAGIFKKNGLDVTIKKIPQKDRHLAIASGDIQCAATTVETWIVWNANGVATTQIFQLDKSYGADGMVVKPTHQQASPT